MSFLLSISTLLCAATVHGACVVNEGLVPCPPPFPDFAVIFRETLNRIPELKLSIQNTTSGDSGGCSPLAVNWSEFNSRLNDGNPVPPLDTFCQQTPPPTTTTAPSYSSSSSSSTRSPEVIPDAVQSRNRIIAIAVGVGGGVVVVAAAVILIIFTAFRCRGQKGDGLQRTISTISQAPLVTEENFQPTTPDTPFAQQDTFGAFDNSHSLRKGVIKLSDCTFQDSSTDGTLPRTKDPTHVTLERGMTTDKETATLEEAKTTGRVNLAAVTEDDEQDDAGYAGSEIGQELWENEINALFEGAKMEEEIFEEDDAAAADRNAQLSMENRGQEEKRRDLGSVRCKETALQIRDSTISTKRALKLDSSSSPEPSAYQSIEIHPAKLPDSPFSTPSSTKPLISPRHFGSRHPLSQQPSDGSDQNSMKVSQAKVRFEIDSNATPPPPYSSPPPLLTLAGADELYNGGDRHAEMPIDVPNELPSYTEAVSALVVGDKHRESSGGWRPVAAKRKPPKPPQTKPRSASSVDSQQKSSVPTSPPGKRTDTAAAAVVARPRVPLPAAKKIRADDEPARRQDRVDSNSEGDNNNTSAGHSSRPVRSLLSQFEAIASGRPD